MPLPENIAVRYTEEDAGYMSVRPVVKQTFRSHELLDMIVSVVGKDPQRLTQILRSGTVVYNGYRYWWDGFEATVQELGPALAQFPEDDPGRAFDPALSIMALLESGGGTQKTRVEISRSDASTSRLFSRETPWDVLLKSIDASSVQYDCYSHARRADLYRISLPYDQAQILLTRMLETAPRKLRHRWSNLKPPSVIVFVNPR